MLFEILGRLVGLSGELREIRSRRQEFFEQVRATIAAVRPEHAAGARAELADIRRRWKNQTFPGYLRTFQARIEHPDNAETLSEYEEHRRLLQTLEPRFMALDAQVLELADLVLDQSTGGSVLSAEDFATRTAFTGPGACSLGEERWQRLKPICLLSRGTVVRVPVAMVDAGEGGAGCIRWLECEVFRHGTGACGPHPLQAGAFGMDFEDAVSHAWVGALRLANDPPVTGMWRFDSSEADVQAVDGGSVGGALALAFLRALKGQKADPRVLVIASVSVSNKLGKVADADIPAKVLAACEHGKIDTIATVTWHCPQVAACLDEYYSRADRTVLGKRRIRVVDVAAVRPASCTAS